MANEVRPQLAADMGEQGGVRVSDDALHPRKLRRTNGRERAHRDRGFVRDSDRIREIDRLNKD